jgi:predicted nucleotidyltransferase
MQKGLVDIEALKRYFETRKDLAFAFLFGSQARGTATKLSDIDIAVYFYPEKRHPVEYEEEKFYEAEEKIWGDLERLLKKEVEMLVLNRASASVAASAIRGIPLAINDWELYLDFMEIVTTEAEDFREMLFADFLERRAFERGTQAASVKTY